MSKLISNIKALLIKQVENRSIVYYAGISLLIILLVFWANYFFAKLTYGGEDFLINWQAARSLIRDGTNPYSSKALQQYAREAAENNILPVEKNLRFSNPLFSLIPYIPFSFFSNFVYARAAWLLVQEISAVITGVLIIRIFKWDLSSKQIVVLSSFSLLFFFSMLNLISSTIYLALNLGIITVIYLLIDEKFEIAGILFALLTLQLRVFVFPIIALITYIIKQKAWSFVIWFLITLFLLITISLLWIPDWPLQYIKELLEFSKNANLQLPGDSLSVWLPHINKNIGNLIFLVILFWIITEFFLTKSSIRCLFWTLALTLTLDQVAWFRSDLNGLVILIFPFFFIFHEWYMRDIKIGLPIIISSVVIFSLGILIISFLNGSLSYEGSYPLYIYLIGPLFLVLNLYWMRWWIHKDQILDNR